MSHDAAVCEAAGSTAWSGSSAQGSPNRRRKSPRSGWNTDDLGSEERAMSLRSASNRSRPFAVLAAWRGVRFPSAGTFVSIQASQCLCINSASSA